MCLQLAWCAVTAAGPLAMAWATEIPSRSASATPREESGSKLRAASPIAILVVAQLGHVRRRRGRNGGPQQLRDPRTTQEVLAGRKRRVRLEQVVDEVDTGLYDPDDRPAGRLEPTLEKATAFVR